MLCLSAWTWLPGRGKEPGQHKKDHTELKLPHSLFHQYEDPLNSCFSARKCSASLAINLDIKTAVN